MRALILVAILVAILGAVGLERAHENAQLLRADPNALPADRALLLIGAARGLPLYDAHCASCHGLGGGGDPARGIPTLRDADWLYGSGSIGDIERTVRYGIRAHTPNTWNLAIMPAYATAQPSPKDRAILPLTPGAIRDLVEYLLYLQGNAPSSARSGRGAQLYHGNGGCYDCHASDAEGDAAIGAPNLTDHITLYGNGDRQALFNSIAYGHQGMCPAWAGRLSPLEIREVAIHVYTLSHPQPRATAKVDHAV